jgi:hypothetical protein
MERQRIRRLGFGAFKATCSLEQLPPAFIRVNSCGFVVSLLNSYPVAAGLARLILAGGDRKMGR